MRIVSIQTLVLMGALAACATAEDTKPQAAPAPAPEAAKPAAAAEEIPVYKTGGEVKIDGVLDEPCWKAATPIVVEWIYSKTGQKAESPRGVFKLAWDGDYLYVAYETFDKNLIAVEKDPAKDPDQGSPGNLRHGAEIWSPDPKVLVDVVELFVSFNDSHFCWELHHNALNDFNDLWITVVDPSWALAKSSLTPVGILFGDAEYIHDQGEHKLAKAVHLKNKADGKPSTPNDASDQDTGYTAELRFPWAGLGAPQAAKTMLAAGNMIGPWNMAGQTVRILSVVQDGDLPERYHHSSPTRPAGGWFHTSYDSWPTYKMVEQTAPPAEAAK